MDQCIPRVLLELVADNTATMVAYMDGEEVCTVTQVSG